MVGRVAGIYTFTIGAGSQDRCAVLDCYMPRKSTESASERQETQLSLSSWGGSSAETYKQEKQPPPPPPPPFKERSMHRGSAQPTHRSRAMLSLREHWTLCESRCLSLRGEMSESNRWTADCQLDVLNQLTSNTAEAGKES